MDGVRVGFMLGSAVFWTICYILTIRKSHRDRSYGMPIVALCANISWEFIFAFVRPQGSVQRPVNIIWFVFDCVIFGQVMYYGPRHFAYITKPLFYGMFGVTLVLAFCSVYFMSYDLEDASGAYSAFGQNMMMSGLYIAMLTNRQSLDGQSLGIAMCKWIGTACASIAFAWFTPAYSGDRTLITCYIGCFVLDALYTYMIWHTMKVDLHWLSRHGSGSVMNKVTELHNLPSPTTLPPPSGGGHIIHVNGQQ